MANNPLLERLGIENPIIQAPMAGGPSTPELTAAVSNAGGLGSLGAAYLTPDQIAEAIGRTRELSDRPFNVNLFAGGYVVAMPADPAPILALLGEIHVALGLPPPGLPALTPDPFPAQLEVVLAARPAVFSFTFGIPSTDEWQCDMICTTLVHECGVCSPIDTGDGPGDEPRFERRELIHKSEPVTCFNHPLNVRGRPCRICQTEWDSHVGEHLYQSRVSGRM